jgi:hypothetical protein
LENADDREKAHKILGEMEKDDAKENLDELKQDNAKGNMPNWLQKGTKEMYKQICGPQKVEVPFCVAMTHFLGHSIIYSSLY